MTWDGTVPTFVPGKVSSTSLQLLADICTHLAQFLTDGPWTSYAPTMSGGGTAVISVGGRYRRISPRTVEFRFSFTVTTAGSGASNVTFSLPTEPDRSVRHLFVGGAEGGTALPGMYAVVFTSGSGASVDRIRYSGATNLTGADLTLAKTLNFSGTYEELT